MFGASLFSCAGMALVAAAQHWALAALGMLLFGVGWVAAASTTQAAAQLVSPPWVRARALAIYQLAFNGALAVGLAEGMEMGRAVRFANAAGAKTCETFGAQPALPTRMEVEGLMEGMH